jgi:hypothetical protein
LLRARDASGWRRRNRVSSLVLSWSLVGVPLLLALLATPASAHAAFSFAGTLSPPGQDAYFANVAIAPNGDAVFVWERYDGTDQCGRTDYGCIRVQARARSTDGTLSAVQTLSAAGRNAYSPHVGVDSEGDAVFSWNRYDGTTQCGGFYCLRVQARARSADGTLSAVQTLSDAGQNAGSSQVEVESDGDALFAWARYDGTTNRIQARARSASGALSAVETLSAPGGAAGGPQIGLAANGNAVFVWSRREETAQCFDPFGSPYPCTRIQTRARSAAGTLSSVQTLSASGQDAGAPEVAVDSDGDAVFVWLRPDGTMQCEVGSFQTGCYRVQTRARSAGGVLSAVQTLSAGGEHAGYAHVTGDSNGNAVFVWQRRDGTTQCLDEAGPSGCERIHARARSADGSLGTVQTLSAGGQHGLYPAVSADPDGGLDPNAVDAVVVWGRSDGSRYRIEAATQIAPPS